MVAEEPLGRAVVEVVRRMPPGVVYHQHIFCASLQAILIVCSERHAGSMHDRSIQISDVDWGKSLVCKCNLDTQSSHSFHTNQGYPGVWKRTVRWHRHL